MYDLLLLQKGMVASSIRALRARISAEGDQRSIDLLDELQQQRTLLANLRRGAAPDAEQQFVALKARIGDVERELVRHSAAFAGQAQIARTRWTAVQDALGEQEAAVEYVAYKEHTGQAWSGEGHYAALVLRRGLAHPRLIVLGRRSALLAAPLTDYRQRAGLERDRSLAHHPGFYEAFWKPLETPLRGARRVYVAPAGILYQIAWAVVAGERGPLLIEQLDLRLVTSTRDLVERAQHSSERTAVLVGDPDFQQPDERRGGRLPQPAAAPHFEALPGTREEVRKVAQLLRDSGWSVTSYEAARATEAAVTSAARPRVLHLATHGFFEKPTGDAHRPRLAAGAATDDPMLRSGLALAGANRLPAGGTGFEGSDGILTALEVSASDLAGTELVVLSACQTAAGSVMGSEGVFGMQRAFRQAGANAILMSLWDVPDDATQELMVRFYRYWLSGLDKSTALHQAQLELKQLITEQWGRDRPQMWAGFVLVEG